jgi:hypothetical protein
MKVFFFLIGRALFSIHSFVWKLRGDDYCARIAYDCDCIACDFDFNLFSYKFVDM